MQIQRGKTWEFQSHVVMSLDRGLTYWRDNSIQVLHETLTCKVAVQGLKARTFARGHQ